MCSCLIYVQMYPAMSKQVIICVLIVSALSSAIVRSRKSVSSYRKAEIYILSSKQPPQKIRFRKDAEISPRIVNGTTARQGQFPWSMAVFQINKVVCMAALITTKTALTASHCFFTTVIKGDEVLLYRENFDGFHGKIGDIRLRHAESVHFRRVILHEDFNYVDDLNDIALLIIEQRVELSERIKTIALPRTHMVYRGSADLAGWGSCFTDSHRTPNNLQFVKMNIMDPTRCANLLHIPLQKEIYICASAERKGPCDSDSGASLIWGRGNNRMSIGVYIGDPENSSIGETEFFASTGYYAEWISENAEGQITFIP